LEPDHAVFGLNLQSERLKGEPKSQWLGF